MPAMFVRYREPPEGVFLGSGARAHALPEGKCDLGGDGVAAGAPVRQLLLVEPLGHARVPFAGVRPDHSTSTVLIFFDCFSKTGTSRAPWPS